ncbi:MAG TPA: CehA/McbA family metallohydrolase [Kofleriaceae bacterium]|nr:CehA/McbA family metallohydrolase [Kofleriaceae bacterium]
MYRAYVLVLVGVTSVLQLACKRTSCLGGDCEATRPCDGLTFTCETQELYVGAHADLPAAMRLALADGSSRAVALSNGVVTAVINELDAPIDLAPTGGTLVDFGSAGAHDDMTIAYQLAGILPDDAFAYDALEIVDRSPAYVAVVVRGHLDGRPDISVATRYELHPCDPGLRVRSELFNGSPYPYAFVVADTVDLGKRRVVPFVPAAGQGYEQPPLDLLELTSQWSSYDYTAGATPATDGPSYSVVSCGDTAIHGVVDLQISSLGSDIELVRAGDGLVLERFLATAGSGRGPAPAIDTALNVRGQLHGDPTRVVSGRVVVGTVAAALPFGGDVRRASVMIFAAPDGGAADARLPVNAVVPGADGTFTAAAPSGEPLAYELWSFGRKVAEGAIGADGAIGDVSIEAPATLQVDVTIDPGAGAPRPAHALVAVVPADDATRAAVTGTLHGRLTPCAPWLGPPDGASPACNHILVEPTGVEVEVPAGHYWLYASAGPEATLARTEVTLVAGEITTQSFALDALAIRPAGWLASDLHVHGRRSFDSGIPDRDRVLSFVAAGVDVIAATDHDVVGDYTAAITALDVSSRLLVMGGLETTQVIPWLDVPGEDLPKVIGHFNFWPLTAVPGEPRAGAPWDELVEPGELFDRLDPLIGPDGVRMINHPWDETQFGRDLGYLRAINFDPRAPIDDTLLRAPGGGRRNLDWDVMEVQNGAGADEWAKTRPLWFSLISAGYPVPGAANSDSHGMRDGQIGWGRTWVETGTPLAQTTPSAFNTALRAGRTVAGSGVFIEVAIGPPGAPRRGLGLTPVVPAAGEVLTITVRAAPWIPVDEVRVVTATGERVLARDLPAPADPFGSAGIVRWQGQVALAELATADGWVVVEAGMALPAYEDLDDDGVPDTGDNNADGRVDDADIEDDEDAGPIENPPDPTDPTDPRFHMTRLVPDSWPTGFTSPILLDVDGNGWTPPGDP